MQDVQDDDDYFQAVEDLDKLCIPDLPPGFNNESDSIDMDDVPCVIEPEAATAAAPDDEPAESSASATSRLNLETAGGFAPAAVGIALG